MNRTPEQDVAACRAFALQLKDFEVARTLIDAAAQIERLALAAGSRRAKTPKAVECEASQSGGEAATPNPGGSMITDKPVISDAMIEAGQVANYQATEFHDSLNERVIRIYTAMHKASLPPEDVVEKVALVLHEKFGVQCSLREVDHWRVIARAALKAMG